MAIGLVLRVRPLDEWAPRYRCCACTCQEPLPVGAHLPRAHLRRPGPARARALFSTEPASLESPARGPIWFESKCPRVPMAPAATHVPPARGAG